MHNLALILQIFALICFFISGMNWQIPQTKPLNWFSFAWFFVVLSFMLSGISFAIHAVGSSQ